MNFMQNKLKLARKSLLLKRDLRRKEYLLTKRKSRLNKEKWLKMIFQKMLMKTSTIYWMIYFSRTLKPSLFIPPSKLFTIYFFVAFWSFDLPSLSDWIKLHPT
eukprot:NODE_39_length_35218_cov_0.479655.p39 type:complete len:103 gc:universal NODE_39_length_35218_cov_0.479655:29057-29365(+)